MKKIVMKNCPRCHGKGSFFDTYIKRQIPCEKCKRTGKVEEEIDVPRERQSSCPDDCHDCPEEHFAECLDQSLIFPAWNSLDSKQKENNSQLACAGVQIALITLQRLSYPNHRIRVDREIRLLWNEEDKEAPKKIKPEGTDISTALLCYSVIGNAWRNGEMSII